MNQLEFRPNYLPETIDELKKFILFGREKLNVVRAQISAMETLDVAHGVRQQKKDEAQMLAEALLDAESRIGHIMLKLPKAHPGPKLSNTAVTQLSKEEATKGLGFDKMQVSRFETLAKNQDLIEIAKKEARENDDLVTRSEVLRLAKVRDRDNEIQKQREDIKTGRANLPEGVFEVIVLDPPWNYGRDYDPDSSRVANPYPEMSQAELMNIQIPAASDAVIFLWTTHAFLFDAKELLDHWGFGYKATIVWDKQKIGMGHWLRMQCEFCLLGIKGSPLWTNTKWRDILDEPRREHSRKPDMFYQMVDEITTGRKLEYFARQQREGWELFGNDTNKFL